MEFTEFYHTRIVSTMTSFDAMGLIDEMQVYDWTVNALKQFGTLLATANEEVIEVENYEAKLPDGFIKLALAYKCEPLNYVVEKGQEDVISSNIWIERHEKTTKWDSCDPCCEEEYEKRIEERVVLKGGGIINYRYKSPVLLKVTETVNRKQCLSDCPNLSVRNSPFEIQIKKNSRRLSANFKEGNIFIKYYGNETGEDGLMEIPETNQGDLINYLEFMVKARILENVVLNGDNVTNEASMIPYYEQKAELARSRAMTDAKASQLTKSARDKWIKKNRNKMRAHEFAFKM